MAWYDILQKWIAEIGGTILLIFLIVRVIMDLYNQTTTFSPGAYIVFFVITFLLMGWKGIAKILAGIKK